MAEQESGVIGETNVGYYYGLFPDWEHKTTLSVTPGKTIYAPFDAYLMIHGYSTWTSDNHNENMTWSVYIGGVQIGGWNGGYSAQWHDYSAIVKKGTAVYLWSNRTDGSLTCHFFPLVK